MYNEINDLFNEMGKAFENAYKDIKNPILVDIEKNDNAYVVYATLPGVEKDNVNLAFEDSKLTISVKEPKEEETKEKEDVKYILNERIKGFNSRTIYLKNVDETKISAKFNNGILEINVPLKEKKVSNIVIE